MRQSELISLVSAVLLGVGAVGAGRYVAGGMETQVTQRVRAQLASIGYEQVEVAADGLVVELSGRVASQRDYEVITTAIGAVEGVGALVDNLVVLTPLVDLRPVALNVQKDAEALTLTGEAPNPEARDLLGARAEVAVGGGRFLNLMKAQDRRAPDAWLAAAEAAIDAVSALRVGRASVERDVVRIEGAAPNAESKTAIATQLRERLGARFTLEMDISAPPPLLSPYVFAARKTVGGFSLPACAAPDPARRALILGALKTLGAEEQAADPDACVIANGAPNEHWAAAVERGVAALGPLTEAELRIQDDRVELIGYLEKDADLEAAAAEARRGWPDRYTLDVDIREMLPIVRPFSLTAMKRPGESRLSGNAPSRDRAVAWAQTLDAGNDLTLARGAPADWAEAADVMIGALARLDVGAATLTDRSFTLAAPGDDEARTALRERLRAALPSGYALEVIEAKTPRILLEDTSPATAAEAAAGPDGAGYGFVARRRGPDEVEIGGVVGDDTSRSVVLAYARAKLGGDSPKTEVSMSQEPPPVGWQRALFAGLEALGALDTGEFKAEPGALSVRGVVGDAAAAHRAAAALASKTPSEFAKFSRIRVVEFAPVSAEQPLGPELTAEECLGALNLTAEKSQIQFESGSATIDPSSAGAIDALSGLARRCPGARLEVGGYTDSQGDPEENLILSRQRASAVRLSMVARGVERVRLVARGYGAASPIASNDTAEGRARNRRIEFKLKVGPDEPVAEERPPEEGVPFSESDGVDPGADGEAGADGEGGGGGTGDGG